MQVLNVVCDKIELVSVFDVKEPVF